MNKCLLVTMLFSLGGCATQSSIPKQAEKMCLTGSVAGVHYAGKDGKYQIVCRP